MKMKTKEIIGSYRVSCADKAVYVDGKGSSLLWLLLWLLCAGHDDILCVVVDSLVVAIRCGCWIFRKRFWRWAARSFLADAEQERAVRARQGRAGQGRAGQAGHYARSEARARAAADRPTAQKMAGSAYF